MTSVFAQYRAQNFPYRFAATFHLNSIAGGMPLDPAVLERHIASKTQAPDNLIRDMVTDIMIERGVPEGEAIEEAAKFKGHVGFERNEAGLVVPGANWKAGIVESACIAAAAERLPARGWGRTNAGVKKWLAEHVFVLEDKLALDTDEPNEVKQSFVHKVLPGRGQISAVQYTEIVYDADVDFTVETDWDFDEEHWAAIWLTAERNGFGAARKRGYGTGELVRWERVPVEDTVELAAA